MAKKKSPVKPGQYTLLDETSQALLESSLEAACVIDSDGNILAANEPAAKLFGQEAGLDIKDLNILENVPEPVSAMRREKIQVAFLEGKPVRFEEELDGRSLLHSMSPVARPWDDVARIAVHTLDLTTLRKTDEDLRREQQRQIFFMESLPGVVYHLYPDKTIRYANRYFRKYFGSPKGKKCGQALQCSSHSCDGCPAMQAMEMDRAVEWDWTDAKGRTFHMQCSPMTDSAGERMIMVLGIDITARKRAEDALKRAHDKLEERVRIRTKELEHANTELTSKSMRLVSAMRKADSATRAKSSFLANMSHEIRTPLNAVLGMAELALRIRETDKKNEYLRRVMEAGNSLLSVINDILDFSKIEARKLTLEKIDFDLRNTMEATMDIHRIQTMSKSLMLNLSVADNVPQTLVGDPSRLKQVLINLVSNAVKFTEEGSVSVEVTMPEGPKSPQLGDDVTLRFAVIDTGVGIPEDKQKAIFKSFQQSDDSVTRKHGGTGLGLAICTLLVELMQGKLRLHSEENKGSTFYFSAHFKVGDPAAVHDIVAEELDGQAMGIGELKVLLADDNALNRQLATTLLEEQGHSCLAVENGSLALDAVREQDFDIVLMDVQMPIMDGLTATRAIRDPNSGARNPAIPIVAISAHALKGDRERFLDAGMNDYIAKPIKLSDFYSTIARAMEGRTVLKAKSVPEEDLAQPEQYDPFDRKMALDMLGGRMDLLTRMDEIFIRDVPGELKELQGFMESHDWDNSKRMAHSIKGSARTVGAQKAGTVAEQMEFYCKQKDRGLAEKGLKLLESEVNFALEFIKGSINAS